MAIIRRRITLAAALVFFAFFGMLSFSARPIAAAEEVPTQLSDEEFWKLVSDLSETAGFFRADNFVSNEAAFQYPIPELKDNTKSGGIYLGVGPDQNFTYIVALKPKMAFIVDIRRQNMLQHLMYKALIEISADRAEFLSRLFSRKRPVDLGASSSAQELFMAFDDVAPDYESFSANLQAIRKRLSEYHGFKLTDEDERSLEYVYRAFYVGGPDLTYNGPSSAGPFNRGRMPTYAELMMETDRAGQNRSYMSSEENFRFLQDMENKNLLVPIVGDFAGPTALRAVGNYVRDHGASVSAFYLSNVEQYLFQQGDDWSRFYSNVGSLPLDSTSTFIRSIFNGMIPPQSVGFGLRSASVVSSIENSLKAFDAGELRTYYDVIEMSH
jgi:hypothetical protein